MMPVKRVHYFDQMSLIESDFSDEQRYHVDMRRRINRLFHAFGLAEGLQVIRSGARQITVKAGLAIDRDGREIVLETDRVLDLSNAGQFPANTTVFVTAAYQEAQSDPSTKGAPGNTRVTESASVSAVAAPPPTDGTLIRLARFVMTGGGDVPGNPNDEIDGGVRQAAGSKIGAGAVAETHLVPSLVNKINAAVASIEGVANPGGNVDIVGQGAIKIDTDVANARVTISETHSTRTDNPHSTTAAQLQVVSVNGGTITGGLQVTGNLGVGVAPSSRLHIGGAAPTMRLSDGTQAAGRVLASDANGSGTWKDRTSAYFASSSDLGLGPFTAQITPSKIADLVTFTKASADSTIEVTLNARGNTAGLAASTGILFQVRVDNNPPAFGNEAVMSDLFTSQFISLFAVFQGLAAGSHTVSLFCRTLSGLSTNIFLESGDLGGRVVVKETF
jgi:hypothetical protein